VTVPQLTQAAATPWPRIAPGTPVRIVKLKPNGAEATNYPGVVFDGGAPAPWISARAEWTHGLVELNGLQFVPGDQLYEYFSPEHPFNLFVIFAPDGQLRGWYANVTYPATLDPDTVPVTLYWHDLYLDLIGLPNGYCIVRDEDELEASGIGHSDPELYAMIVSTRDELLRRFELREFPFHDTAIRDDL
jgi:protein associated with RNAse G/E